MNHMASSSIGFWLAYSGIGLALGANVALADKAADVVVQADSSAMSVMRVARGSPVHLVSLARSVSYADIDFNSPAADADLQKRIGEAAAELCRRIGERYPQSLPGNRDCTAIAVKDALRKIRAGELAAQRRASN